ncbi:MAG: lysophospholipid acyltransferase family protein [Flavobacteriales bacterium]|nr:lysophospholipid acyltransferase family protein [Flavobacteriales bacterium]
MGSKLLYYLIIKPISLCPYWFLYGLSDFFFVVLYYVVGYRKTVVSDNLEKSFPEKESKELLSIRRRFYHHFCDLVIESLKNFSISEKQATERMTQINTAIVDEWVAKRGGVILCTGHFGNWELWAAAAPYGMKYPIVGIYKRLSSAFFDEKMRESRSKSGIILVSTRETGNYLRTNLQLPKAIAFAFDQSPADPEKCVWINFMGRDTAAYFGAEKYGKELNYPIIFGSIDKVKRGHYEITYTLVSSEPRDFQEGELIQILYVELEKKVRQFPEYYLWTHKRWKHRRKKT